MTAPQVSVVVPMRNAEFTIEAALQSILTQSQLDLEIVVVNDCSTDRSTQKVLQLKDPRVRLIDGPGTGLSDCLNLGFATARGSIVMRCDADDLYPLGRISEQVAFLNSHPNVAAVCGTFEMIDVNSATICQTNPKPAAITTTDITAELLQGVTRSSLCTFAIRKSALVDLGGFRRYFEVGEDIDFQLRLATTGPIYFVNSNWYRYRIHGASITHSASLHRLQYFESQARQAIIDRVRTGTDLIESKQALPYHATQVHGKNEARSHIATLLIGAAWQHFHANEFSLARQSMVRLLILKPFSAQHWDQATRLFAKSFVAFVTNRNK